MALPCTTDTCSVGWSVVPGTGGAPDGVRADVKASATCKSIKCSGEEGLELAFDPSGCNMLECDDGNLSYRSSAGAIAPLNFYLEDQVALDNTNYNPYVGLMDHGIYVDICASCFCQTGDVLNLVVMASGGSPRFRFFDNFVTDQDFCMDFGLEIDGNVVTDTNLMFTQHGLHGLAPDDASPASAALFSRINGDFSFASLYHTVQLTEANPCTTIMAYKQPCAGRVADCVGAGDPDYCSDCPGDFTTTGCWDFPIDWDDESEPTRFLTWGATNLVIYGYWCPA